MKNLIITIGRQYGCGGRDVGEKLAEDLGVPFYDKELVEMAADKSNINAGALKNFDEKAANSFLYSLQAGNYSLRGINAPLFYEMPINDRLFIAQSEVIKEVAAQGPCVIVGRCADYVLESVDCDLISVFIYATQDYRIKRVMEAFGIARNKAKDMVVKTEKQRRTYYDYYTSRQWGVMSNYDLCINAEKTGIDGTVELLKSYINTIKK